MLADCRRVQTATSALSLKTIFGFYHKPTGLRKVAEEKWGGRGQEEDLYVQVANLVFELNNVAGTIMRAVGETIIEQTITKLVVLGS